MKFKNEKFDYSDYLNLSSRRIKEIVHRNHDIKKWVNKTKKQLKSNNPAILIDLNKSLNSDSDKISNFRLFNIFLTIFLVKYWFKMKKIRLSLCMIVIEEKQ